MIANRCSDGYGGVDDGDEGAARKMTQWIRLLLYYDSLPARVVIQKRMSGADGDGFPEENLSSEIRWPQETEAIYAT
jgi:hypothetical protein